MSDFVDDLSGVVNRAVVSAELNDGKTERALGVAFLGDTFLEIDGSRRLFHPSKQFFVNAADKA